MNQGARDENAARAREAAADREKSMIALLLEIRDLLKEVLARTPYKRNPF